jgi:hypothetical protein
MSLKGIRSKSTNKIPGEVYICQLFFQSLYERGIFPLPNFVLCFYNMIPENELGIYFNGGCLASDHKTLSLIHNTEMVGERREPKTW